LVSASEIGPKTFRLDGGARSKKERAAAEKVDVWFDDAGFADFNE